MCNVLLVVPQVLNISLCKKNGSADVKLDCISLPIKYFVSNSCFGYRNCKIYTCFGCFKFSKLTVHPPFFISQYTLKGCSALSGNILYTPSVVCPWVKASAQSTVIETE